MRSPSFGALALLMPMACAQTPPATQNATEVASQDASIIFQSKVNVVLVPVVVHDKTGKPFDGLTKDDFQLFDKGRPQVISRISVEKTDSKTIAPASATERSPDSRTGDTYTPGVATPSHFVAWFFDDIHLGAPDLILARRAAEKYLADGLKETDRAAIFTTSGQTTVEFTDDTTLLRAGLAKLSPHPVARPAGQQCPDVSYYMGDLIVNKRDATALEIATEDTYHCMNLPNMQVARPIALSAASRALNEGEHESRLSLDSLKDLVRRMGSMPGHRLIVLISPGFLRLNDQLQDESDIIDRAIKANVTISALDARGLYTDTPDISRHTVSPRVTQMEQQYDTAAQRAGSDVMGELADATGGTFFENSNDLNSGIKDLSAAPRVYYVLAFSPQNLKLDGSYHTLKVSVRQPGLSARARRGYYAPRHLTNADEEAKEEVAQALFSRDEMRDIPVEIHTEFFKPTDDEAELSVNTRIDVRKLRYRKTDGRNGDELLVVAGLFDRNGNFLQSVTKKISMRLKDETLAVKLNAGIGVHADFKIAPGRYVVRLVVRDTEGQMMAAQTGGVEIP